MLKWNCNETKLKKREKEDATQMQKLKLKRGHYDITLFCPLIEQKQLLYTLLGEINMCLTN